VGKTVPSGPATEHNQAPLECVQMNISCGRSEQISMVAEIQARGSNTLLQLEIVQISDWRMYTTTQVSRPAIYSAFSELAFNIKRKTFSSSTEAKEKAERI
jgi:hypothetical protein